MDDFLGKFSDCVLRSVDRKYYYWKIGLGMLIVQGNILLSMQIYSHIWN